jgi:hypothetical protein
MRDVIKEKMFMIRRPLLLRDERVTLASNHKKTTFKIVNPSGPCSKIRITELWGRNEMRPQTLLDAMEAKVVAIQQEK